MIKRFLLKRKERKPIRKGIEVLQLSKGSGEFTILSGRNKFISSVIRSEFKESAEKLQNKFFLLTIEIGPRPNVIS